MNKHLFYRRVSDALNRDLEPTLQGAGMAPGSIAFAAITLFKTSLFKKATDTANAMSQADLLQKAFSTFVTVEERCRETNRKSFFLDGENRRVDQVLYLTQQKIGSLLGDATHVDLFRDCQHGPGSTRSLKRDSCGVDNKYGETKISVTSTAMPIFREVSAGIGWPVARGIQDVYGPTWLLPSEFLLVEADKLDFVPKNATSLRSISVGPTANVYLQSGIGKYLSKRLLRWGINLRDQTLNSDLARWGSFSGALATVDLSTASNLISCSLVEFLFPPRVLWAMKATRVKYYEYKGETHPYQMFSGMGNGFTFPMQTIIFYALAWACCEVSGVPNVFTATYGDDIIIPVDAYPLLRDVFSYCGFTINEAKSFVDGPFRESCGGQYVRGIDIRPVYWKGFDAAAITAQEICKLYHLLALWQERVADYVPLLTHTRKFLSTLAHRLDKECPRVPMNAPVGSGFPDPWCALDTISLRVYDRKPLLRQGRHDSLYCFALDGRAIKQIGEPVAIDPEYAPGFIGPRREQKLQQDNMRVPVYNRFTWRIIRRGLCLGYYAKIVNSWD